MKKTYICPISISISLASEESFLLTASNGGKEDIALENIMTREQNIDSPWDNWNE